MNILPTNQASSTKANPTLAPKLEKDAVKQLAGFLSVGRRQRSPVDRFVDKWFGAILALGGGALIGWAALYNCVINNPNKIAKPETGITGKEVPGEDEDPLIVEPLPDLPQDKQETEEGVWIEIPVEPQRPASQPDEKNQEPPKIEKPSQEPKQDQPATEEEFEESAFV